jgi:RNA polymerase sigma-70 factor (ECF subfamily)
MWQDQTVRLPPATKGPMPLALLTTASSPPVDVDVDAALVERARRGEQAAFSALFRANHGRVHAMCTRLLGGGRGDGDVDDAVQQTFLEAWRCLHRFEGKSRFSTWLTRIAIHTCFSVRRRFRRLLLAQSEEQAVALVDVNVDEDRRAAGPVPADEQASRRARSRALDDVLRQVAPKKRVVFVLADIEELSSPEIAAILGVPETTVRTRLHYARREIAALLQRHPGFADLDLVRTPDVGAERGTP